MNPQFGESGPHGFSQQDAAEAWQTLMTTMRAAVPAPGLASPPPPNQSIVDQLFGVRLKITLKNDENPDEPVSVNTENELALSCAITKDVGFMASGIRVGLSGSIEKHSPTLNREALYTKTSQIDRLPG